MAALRLWMILLLAVVWCLPGCVANSILAPTELPQPATMTQRTPLPPPDPLEQPGLNPLQKTVPPVTTVASQALPARRISLAECLAIALENGRTGEFFDAVGSERRTSVTGSGRATSATDSSDSMRVFAYDPAIMAIDQEQSLARFDPFWTTDFNWMRTNRLSQELNLNPADELILKNQLDAVGFNSTLLKPLPTGGVAGMFFTDNFAYQPQLPSTQFINPAYRPMAGLLFEQPLLRGAGVGINQLLDVHPGSLRNPYPTSSRTPGILLTRISQTKSQIEFERRVHELVFKVEEAYWGLYSAYWELHSRENGMRQAHRAWLSAKNKQAAGGMGEADVAMIEEQYHYFRTQRLEAMGRGVGGRPGVLEAERRLRYILGLPAEDGTRLVPDDSPELQPIDFDWDQAWMDATHFRPELKQLQEDLKAAQLAVQKTNDMLKPDLRLYSRSDFNGLGNGFSNGFQNLITDGRPEWEVGMKLQMPLGFREGHAEVNRARLLLAQRMALLRDQEQKLIFSLQRSHRDVTQFREEIQTRHSQEEAAARQLRARLQKWNAGGAESIDLILRAQRNWVDAMRDERSAICSYRIGLADYERQKGTILQSHNIVLTEGYVPQYVMTNASKQIRHWREQPRRATVKLLAPANATSVPESPQESIATIPFDPGQLLESVAKTK